MIFILTLKTSQTIGVTRKLLGQRLDRYFTPELRVPRTPDRTHAALAELVDNFVGSERLAEKEAQKTKH